MKKANIIIIIVIITFITLLSFFMFSSPVHGQVTAEQFYEQTFQKHARAATDHEVWVWCNVCHQHVPEINGVMYDWDPVNQCITAQHPHQKGFSYEEVPIGDIAPLIYISCLFVITIALIILIRKI